MAFPFTALFTTVASAIGGFFGFKKNQTEVLQTSMKVLSDTSASNAQREQAVASIIAAEASSSHWLAAVWRPILMITFASMLLSYWWGYAPPNIDAPMPPVLEELFGLIKLGIGGYIGARTIEKVISNLNLSSVLKKFLDKTVG